MIACGFMGCSIVFFQFAGGVPAWLAARQSRQRRIEPLRYTGHRVFGSIFDRRIGQSTHAQIQETDQLRDFYVKVILVVISEGCRAR